MTDNEIKGALFITQKEFNDIYDRTPFERINRKILNLFDRTCNEDPCQKMKFTSKIGYIKKNLDLNEFVLQLQNRMVDVAKCYTMLSFYYLKNIPDDEWYISPGRNGQSIEYFPNFEFIHYQIKDWFDYYADTFYYKYFSALDNIGHIMNLKYNLSIEHNVYFDKSIKNLKGDIYKNFNDIINEKQYKKAKKFRNDITHNFVPATTGLNIQINENSGSFGIRQYITSKEINDNIYYLVLLMEKIIRILDERL